VNSQAAVGVPKMVLENIAIKENGKTVWENAAYVGGTLGITAGGENAEYVAFNVMLGLRLTLLSFSSPFVSGGKTVDKQVKGAANRLNSLYPVLPENGILKEKWL
jgi:hypothetical protein